MEADSAGGGWRFPLSELYLQKESVGQGGFGEVYRFEVDYGQVFFE